MSERSHSAVEALLSRHLGLDPASIGSPTIAAAVAMRMAAVGASTEGAYLEQLARADELGALIDAVVVPESWFLRDEEPFRYLAAHARADWGARRPLRVLSAPCAAGEEPYSIALTLLEAGFAPDELRIDAIDVSAAALQRARAGLYGERAFRGEGKALRDRWFERRRGDYALPSAVRALVAFRQGNLLDARVVPRDERYEAVFCRNLFIYLTPDARVALVERLHGLLAPDGLLFTGHAEGLASLAPGFVPQGPPGAFAFARAGEAAALAKPQPTPRRSPPASPRAAARDAASPAAEGPAPTRSSPRPAADDARRDEATHARAARETAGSGDGDEPRERSPRALLAEAFSLADRGALEEAVALCERVVRAEPDAGAYALLGSVEQARGRAEAAERAFSRALYCDPAHYTALVQLALLRERRGDLQGAANLRRRAGKSRGGGA